MKERKHPVAAALDGLMALVILASVAQVFLSDWAVAERWGRDRLDLLALAGFCFDLVFSVEFAVRSIAALAARRFRRYFVVERGWIDLLCSLPLLVLNSGPETLLMLADGNFLRGVALPGFLAAFASGVALPRFLSGFATILKSLRVVKAIRVSRVLRLLRVLKIFGRIQNADSRMVQRHVSGAAAVTIFAVVFTVMGLEAFGRIGTDSLVAERVARHEATLAAIPFTVAKTGVTPARAALAAFTGKADVALVVFNPDSPAPTVLAGTGTVESARASFPRDSWVWAKSGPFGAMVRVDDILAVKARYDLAFLTAILAATLLFFLAYARSFAQGVSDVVYVMSRGFRERDYNLRVRIDPDRADEELMELADYYNEVFLPAKKRKADGTESSRISLDDVLG